MPQVSTGLMLLRNSRVVEMDWKAENNKILKVRKWVDEGHFEKQKKSSTALQGSVGKEKLR